MIPHGMQNLLVWFKINRHLCYLDRSHFLPYQARLLKGDSVQSQQCPRTLLMSLIASQGCGDGRGIPSACRKDRAWRALRRVLTSEVLSLGTMLPEINRSAAFCCWHCTAVGSISFGGFLHRNGGWALYCCCQGDVEVWGQRRILT